jgi:hypothetical protein
VPVGVVCEQADRTIAIPSRECGRPRVRSPGLETEPSRRLPFHRQELRSRRLKGIWESIADAQGPWPALGRSCGGAGITKRTSGFVVASTGASLDYPGPAEGPMAPCNAGCLWEGPLGTYAGGAEPRPSPHVTRETRWAGGGHNLSRGETKLCPLAASLGANYAAQRSSRWCRAPDCRPTVAHPPKVMTHRPEGRAATPATLPPADSYPSRATAAARRSSLTAR